MTNSEMNTEVPNAGRVYDYVLGGHHNFEADRQAANYMISLVPSTPKWVRMLRQFVREAVYRLREEGFEHFLDIGSGLPTADHIHSLAPEAKVIYVDSDPVTAAYGNEILGDNPNVRYIVADARDVDAILESPVIDEMFGDNRKVAISYNAMSCFFTAEENHQIMQALYEWAAPGSRLFATFETKDPELSTPQIEQFVDMFNQMGTYYEFTTVEEAKAFMSPWQVKDEELKPLAAWLGVDDQFTEEDREGVDMEFYAAFFTKPS